MNNQKSSPFAPVLVAALFVAVFIVIERLTGSGKDTGTVVHFGVAFFWSVMATLLLWSALERARVIPPSMRIGLWGREEWSPRKIYGTLITLIALCSGPALVLFFRGSTTFVLPFVVAATLVILLLFYWLYQLRIVSLVVGVFFLVVGFIDLIIGTIYFEIHTPIPTWFALVVRSVFILVSLLFCYLGITLIRRRKEDSSWRWSWRGFGWAFLATMGLAMLSMAWIGALPLGAYMFIYGLGKLVSSAKKYSAADRIDALTQTVSAKNFLLFAIADRGQWEEERQGLEGGRSTLTTVMQSLFDLLVIVGVVVAFVLFREATALQQLSFTALIILFHIAANLNEYHSATRDTVIKERARLEQELRTAHDMQMGLMPKEDPKIAGFDISGLCLPANEVGGDYFDYVWLDQKRMKLGIAIADVSGKAMKAAMTAVMTSGMVYSEIGNSKSPREILRKMNRPMYLKTDRRVFTAMSFALIDTKAKTLSFSNAGQTLPMLVRGGKLSYLKVKGDRLPLGVKEDLVYDEVRLKLKKGDSIFFYTDGLPEATNEAKEMYGFERMEGFLKDVAKSSAKEMVEAVMAEFTKFSGKSEQHDDMTVVVVRVV